jgi:antitoxin VapB
MTAPIKTNAFKNGNSVAVRLPKELGVKAGEPLEVVRVGNDFKIRRLLDPAAERAKVVELVRRLRELGPVVGATDDREDTRIEFPDRPGLY